VRFSAPLHLILIPKNVGHIPQKKRIIKIMNTLIAVHKEILDRSLASSSIVRPTKIGTVPIGFKQKIKRQINI
jgi:hypothetical protein